MKAKEYYRHVESLVKRHFPTGSYRVVDQGEYGNGLAAHVTVEISDLLVRFSTDRGDFYIDVASTNDREEWWYLLHLLLLISGEPPDREKVLVGKNPADLERQWERLVLSLPDIRQRFSDERRQETKKELEAVRAETMHPLLRNL